MRNHLVLGYSTVYNFSTKNVLCYIKLAIIVIVNKKVTNDKKLLPKI